MKPQLLALATLATVVLAGCVVEAPPTQDVITVANNTTTLYECNQTTRYDTAWVSPGVGAADAWYMCGKNSSEAYTWTLIEKVTP